MKRKILLIFFAVLFPSALFAYLPTRWNPLDIYMLKGDRKGPRSIIVKSGGKIKESATLKYDGLGRLEKEIYRNKNGTKKGVTNYYYKNSRLIAEKLYNSRGKLIEEKRFFYSKNGRLLAMKLFDTNRELVMKQSYIIRNSKIISGREIAGGNVDIFVFRYKKGRPVSMRVVHEKGKELGRVTFIYRADGRLRLRIREQNGEQSKCVYEYSTDGRLESYSYFERRRSRWFLEKTLIFNY